MISIIAVDYHGKEFKDILIDSVQLKTRGEYELLIHDNGIHNIGHGAGLDALVKKAKGDYILALDIDSHIMMNDWDLTLLARYAEKKTQGIKLIAGQGGTLKPIRPCVAFFERDYFLDNKMSFKSKNVDGAKFDVGILFYFQVLSLGDKVSFFRVERSTYKDVRGNNYHMGAKPFVYHHWYGTRWFNQKGKRVHDTIDGVTFEEFERSKNLLIKQYNAANRP